MQGLNLHSGGVVISFNDLAYLPTPPPTATYFPVDHHDYVSEIHRVLSEYNIEVLNETLAVSKQGVRLFGIMELEGPDPDWTTILGLRNSHDGQFHASISVGAKVFVCSNLSFTGDIVMKRKHTKNIYADLPTMMRNLISTANERRADQAVQINHYKDSEITIDEGHHLLTVACQQKVFPQNRFLDVVQEFEKPRHPEFLEHGRTAWTLFNAATEVLKETSVALLPERTSRLHALLDTHLAPVFVPAPEVQMDLFGTLLQNPMTELEAA